jgi:hypothetical protein
MNDFNSPHFPYDMNDLTPLPPDIPSTSRPIDNAHGQSDETFFHLQSLAAQEIIKHAVPHLVAFARMMGHGENYEKVAHILKEVDAFYREQERCWATGQGWGSVGRGN